MMREHMLGTTRILEFTYLNRNNETVVVRSIVTENIISMERYGVCYTPKFHQSGLTAVTQVIPWNRIIDVIVSGKVEIYDE